MAGGLRVLSSPVRVTGGIQDRQLATLRAAHDHVQQLRAAGDEVEWIPGVIAGDLASQLAVEQALAREGLDRDGVGREEFVARAKAEERAARAEATETLAALGIDVDLDAGVIDNDAVALAARTAFVRLYEAGRLSLEERVVSTCPRCATVVDDVDAEHGTAEGEQRILRLPLTTGDELAVAIVAIELLPGVVAVAVPAGDAAEGAEAVIPIAGRTVPVVADPDRAAAALVVPAHDPHDLELARKHAFTPVIVLDTEGTVAAPGALAGLGRYAARAAAAELLAAEGVIGEPVPVDEAVARCRRCGTVVVPRLGRHWFLPMDDIEVLAADAVRQGAIEIDPGAYRDELLAAAGQRGDWCLSHQVWAGQPVPVATCSDCGQATVAVEAGGSCNKCMGTLVPDDDVLDARFVGSLWPLAVAGWPSAERVSEVAAETALVIAPTGLVLWAVRMAGIGLRLAGAAPFSRVLVHE